MPTMIKSTEAKYNYSGASSPEIVKQNMLRILKISKA